MRLRDARLDRPLVAALTLLERFTLPRGEGEGEGEIASLRMERPLMLSARGVRRRSATAALAAGDTSRPAFSAPALSAASKRSRIMEMVCRRCVGEVESAAAALRRALAAAPELDHADARAAQRAAWEKARAELEKYSGALREYVAEDAELVARAAEFAPTLQSCEAALALEVE